MFFSLFYFLFCIYFLEVFVLFYGLRFFTTEKRARQARALKFTKLLVIFQENKEKIFPDDFYEYLNKLPTGKNQKILTRIQIFSPKPEKPWVAGLSHTQPFAWIPFFSLEELRSTIPARG